MRRAFTLVELLLTILIIAVLLALLLPSLHGARDSGRGVVCLSNLKQIAAAYLMYDMDHERFASLSHRHNEWPSPYSYRFGWGGTHHYGVDEHGNPVYPEDQPLHLQVGRRPLNPYVGRDLVGHARDEVFYCPNDTGVYIPAAGDWGEEEWPWFNYNPTDPEAGSVYAFLGNSYESNPRLYTRYEPPLPLQRVDYGFADVHVDPSRFVLVGDCAAMRQAHGGYINRAVIQAEWHGRWKGQMAHGDGSARLHGIIRHNENGKAMAHTNSLGYTFRLRY